ncbi:GntR family transcriptional regulator [Pseudomonas benzenivorans]|uniref:GntR family transcriptional regulator n=1 Tax=Pseudomonas benzenivorans TaxID=556533 RepID=A0ABZ0PZT0_9PSED|nr:GntR family transcriptional regulator [Pseudomonas benzenivorans]WPC06236.1 GntR family transcriptional regulator [Pseudomonas benzenivorans]
MKAAERIRLAIEDGIRTGALPPGTVIDEAEFMRKYKISRTPLREAMLQLQAQGLLTSQPRGGMIVTKMNLQQLLALWELLAELEGLCARLACERMTDSERQQLEQVLEAAAPVVEANDLEAWKAANQKFHELIYRGCRNPFLREHIFQIRARTGAYRQHAFGAVGHLQSSWAQHRDVVTAILSHDGAAAYKAMVRHLSPGLGVQGFASFVATLPQELLA